MILQDIVTLARHSELSSVSIKDDDNVIISFLNMGLIEIYKRFPISVEEYIVNLVEGQTLYDLPSNFMYALSAYGETANTGPNELAEISINDGLDPFSVFIPNYKQIQIPLTAEGAYVSLLYVTKPASYTSTDMNVEVDLHDALIDPLLHYIGYKAHLGIRSGQQGENNSHFYRFERACDKARELGVAHPAESLDMTNRIPMRGFV